MSSVDRLYTPEVLALATSLAAYPLDPGFPLQGSARSKSCGSSITLGLELDETGRIGRVGLKSQACAIGQAASAIFAAAARGCSASDIASAEAGISDWLSAAGPLPEWPGLDVIVTTRDFPGRHAAILLPWKAARELLPTG